MSDFLDLLPKSLSDEERAELYKTDIGKRTLSLVDALTDTLATAVARMTVAESNVRTVSDSWRIPCERAESEATDLRAENKRLREGHRYLGDNAEQWYGDLTSANILLARLNTWNETEGCTDDLVLICNAVENYFAKHGNLR